MNDPDPAELSAFLDNELTPERADEIAARVAADPDLRAELDRLRHTDHVLKSIADSAAFRPKIRLSEAETRWPMEAWLVLPAAAILLVWAIDSLSPLITNPLFLVNAALLFLFIACLTPFALREARAYSQGDSQ